MKRKIKFVLAKIFLTLLFLIPIALTISANILFADGKTPKIGNYYIYIVKASDNMWTICEPDSAVLALADEEMDYVAVAADDVILCHTTDDPDTVTIRKVREIKREDSIWHLTVIDDSWEPQEYFITNKEVVAQATHHPKSKTVGKAILFVTSLKGTIAIIGISLLFILLVLCQKFKENETDDE